MAAGQKIRIGYKQTAIEQGDGTFAEQVMVTGRVPASSVQMEGRYDVGATSAILVPANATRRQVFIVNNGEQTVYLRSGQAAAVGQGWHLAPEEAIVYEHALAIHAVVASGTGSVQVLEENF